MRLAGLCFVIGTLCGLATGARPLSVCCLLLLLPLCAQRRSRLPLLCVMVGAAWAVIAIHSAELALLPAEHEDQVMVLGARVASFPMPARVGLVL
jgi:hypothetical protein